jgi:hypothetical protein
VTFVKQGEEHEIPVLGFLLTAALHDPLEHSSHVPESVLAVGQRQLPSPVVGHGRGVVEVVRVGADRSFPAAPQDPLLLEPGHVPDLPEQRVHDFQAGAKELIVIEVSDQLEGSLSRLADPCDQLSRGWIHDPSLWTLT